MRKLQTSDILAFCRCLKKIGIKDEIKNIAKNSNSVRCTWDKGFELIWNIFDVATEEAGEQHLYKFLAGPFELTPEEVADLPIPELFANLKQLAAENDLAGFFDSAAALTKRI